MTDHVASAEESTFDDTVNAEAGPSYVVNSEAANISYVVNAKTGTYETYEYIIEDKTSNSCKGVPLGKINEVDFSSLSVGYTFQTWDEVDFFSKLTINTLDFLSSKKELSNVMTG
ncbi:12950_t:CDS:2 [Racocetra fulgida]|uniref:12950_t:CDS:1 n=1 Tax=Racocetra fulgida TaxID=60492 RepID=A0A9N9AJ19_9GLOM|nr:12950_t:CDS:2 [Racocetra fulgida]